MSAIHYKFSSSNEYKNVTFDGLNISLFDLKKAIMEKQKLKSTELDLHITNAQTLQVYKDESLLIPKNTAVLVRRIPLGPIRDSKIYVVKRKDLSKTTASVTTTLYQENEATPKLSLDELTKTSNLAKANASEDDKIKAAIAQSTLEYDPKKFMKPARYGAYKNSTNASIPSSQIRCYRCNQQGHYSGQCPLPKGEMQKQYHPATGIPRSHMVEVSKDSKGAMLTSDGKYVVPVMDKKGYEIGKKERPPFVPIQQPSIIQDDDEDEPIPDELICLLCKDLLIDAVVIPCCGNSYCDECIRNALLESESHQCPTCKKTDISPDSLIANKFLRQAVNKFRNDTGIKRSNAPVWPRPVPTEVNATKQSQPVKYGPPRTSAPIEAKVTGSGYKVKGGSDQVVATSLFSLSKRTAETGGSSSPRDPNQPIRIKLAKSDKAEAESNQSTPSEPKMQSTPVENNLSLPASTSSDSYTFNSTPDSNELKYKSTGIEPLPPGLSPPTAKVVRSLETQKKETSQPVMQLSGIEPLGEVEKPTDLVPTSNSQEFERAADSVESNSADAAPPQSPQEKSVNSPTPAVHNEVNGEIGDAVVVDQEHLAALPSDSTEAATSISTQNLSLLPPGESDLLPVNYVPEHDFDASEVSTSDVESVTPVVVPTQSRDTNAAQTNSVLSRMPLNILNNLNPVNVSVPPLSVAPVHQPPTSIPPLLPPHLIPGLVPGIPPPVSGTANMNIFQQPPPPFPFLPSMTIPPGQFSQPPPAFPPHPTALPPPPAGLTIPSLVKTSSSASLPPPPGLETASASTVSSTELHLSSRRERHSPRKRSDRRGNKSKLDIMSDEFAEKLKKRPTRHRRNRSRSRSYSSESSYSDSSSYSSSNSSRTYSSSQSWSSSSYSRSRSRSPRKKRREKRLKHQRTKDRRKRSASWSDRSLSRDRSRNRRSYSRGRDAKKRRDRASPKRKRREDRNYSPRSPRKRSSYSSRGRSRSPHRSRRPPSPRRNRVDSPHSNGGKIESIMHRLPTREEADYERDQALYTIFKHSYEKDWLELRILPPPPYDRFVRPPFAKSPSPPVIPQTFLQNPQLGFPPFPPPMHAPPPHPQIIDPQLGVPRLGLLPQAPPPWDPTVYGQVRPEQPPIRDLHIPEPRFSDMPPRHRHLPAEYDPKEEQYRLQLSPRSRRRFDMDRQARDSRLRQEHRDNRYGGNQRRHYDGYQSRKRGRDHPRDLSSPSRGSLNRNKRTRQSPVNTQDEGDATPVRDERPPPDEPVEKRPIVTRRAGDVTKVGKKPRREKKSESVDRSKQKRSDSPSKRESKSSSRPSKNESSTKSERSTKRKAESSRDRKGDTSRDRKGDSSRDNEAKSKASGSSTKEKSASTKKKTKGDDDRTIRESESKLVKADEEAKDVKQSVAENQNEKPFVDKRANEDEDKLRSTSSSSNSSKVVKQPVVETKKEKDSEIEKKVEEKPDNKNDKKEKVTSALKTPKSIEETKEQPSLDKKQEKATEVKKKKDHKTDDDNGEKLQTSSKPTKSDEKTLAQSPAEKKKEKSGKIIKLNRDKTKQSSKWDPKHVTKAKKSSTNADASSKPTEVSKKSSSSSSSRTASKPKLLEYDGTGPPPAGNELVKITIPKSKWEESDEEGRAPATAPESKEESLKKDSKTEPKPKGRRIRLKRKSPPPKPTGEVVKKAQSPDVSSASDKAKSQVLSSVKKLDTTPPPAAKESISDARMVITLRRNSRQNEERGRRVSLGNVDEARFEPDYVDHASSPDSPSSGKVSSRNALLRTTSKESRTQEDPDALKLSDYSNFSNEESEKTKKSSKKKKKKKKKRKLRSQISDNVEENSRKKSRSYEDSMSDDHESSEHERRTQRRNAADHRKRYRGESSADEKSQKKEIKKKRHDESRDRLARNNYDSKSRDKRRGRDYADRRDGRYDRSRDKRRKKDKRQKHRRHHGSSSEYSDAELDVR